MKTKYLIDNEDVIKVLTELLIKQTFEDKEKGKETYVKKTRIFKDLIEYFKQFEIECNEED